MLLSLANMNYYGKKILGLASTKPALNDGKKIPVDQVEKNSFSS